MFRSDKKKGRCVQSCLYQSVVLVAAVNLSVAGPGENPPSIVCRQQYWRDRHCSPCSQQKPTGPGQPSFTVLCKKQLRSSLPMVAASWLPYIRAKHVPGTLCPVRQPLFHSGPADDQSAAPCPGGSRDGIQTQASRAAVFLGLPLSHAICRTL